MGYGDWLMLSGKVRELHDLFPGAKIVVTPEMEKSDYFREIFRSNPYITLRRALAPAEPFICLASHEPGRVNEDGTRIVWLDNFQAVRGDLFFTPDEMAFAHQALNDIRSAWQNTHGRQPPRVIAVNPWTKREQPYSDGSVKTYHHATNKEWGIEKYQQLVARLVDYAALIQFSPNDAGRDEVLKHAYQVRCDSYRQAASVLKLCDLYVGAEGGLHHGAAAVEKPAVVIFGGWISPKTTGYPYHENIYVGDINSPCGALYSCTHCKACMEKISVEDVFDRVDFLLSGAGHASSTASSARHTS
jgi:ADP-heptose:LPS heptosyltransferase